MELALPADWLENGLVDELLTREQLQRKLCDLYVTENYKDVKAISIQDYARKVCRASLEADLKFNRMRRGECTHKEWQETQKAFDEMSKSANFAACQRKGEANAGMTSISEIMDLIEIEGIIEKKDVIWEQDHIDLVCADFRYTDVAVS